MHGLGRLSTLATLAALALATACSHDEPHRPNIVLVSIDSLRADHLHCYGYERETSPTIDALARDGVRFDAAISTTSWTLPAHAAMFTGLYDRTHGLFDNGLRLAPEHTTLAEELKELGYHTAGFFGGPYLHPTFGLGDGFDVYRSCMTTVANDLSDEQLRSESRSPKGRSHDDVTGPRTVEEVTRWAETRPADRPFFLFVHLWDVHYDFIPPPPYDRMFDPDYAGSITGVDFMGNAAVNPRMDPRDLAHVVALYDGEIRATDENLGKILAALRERGMLEDTLVLITADHGEEFFEHGNKGHQKTLFDESVRVPLIVSGAGVEAKGRAVADQVRLIDLMPTLLARAGATKLPSMQGRDVWPLVQGESLAAHDALCELHADGQDQRALRTRELKAYSPGSVRGHRFLDAGFDLAQDPHELKGMPKGSDERLAPLFERLELVTRAADALREYLGAKSQAIALDDETRARLEQLGYIEPGGK